MEQAVISSSFEVQLFTLFLLTFVVNFLRVIIIEWLLCIVFKVLEVKYTAMEFRVSLFSWCSKHTLLDV